MAGRELIIRKVLLSFQFCLGFWQIVKLTGFAAILKAFVSRLGTFVSSPYFRLKKFENGPFFGKYGECLVTREGDQSTLRVTGEGDQSMLQESIINIEYLGKKFCLERRDGYKLFVNEKMEYYITDLIWHCLLSLKIEDNQIVFLKGHKVLFTDLIIGGVMELSEVLDCVILKNHIVKSLSYGAHSLFLPINLSISEEKLLKALNLVGLFLQAEKQVFWIIPTLLSFTSAVLEFSTPLRVWIYSKVNHIFCWVTHALCDRLPLKARMWIYSLLDWVENLKPSNDIEWRMVRGNLNAVIGGGAKACSEIATLVQTGNEEQFVNEETFVFDQWTVELKFEESKNKGKIGRFRYGKRKEYLEVDCGRDEYRKLRTFIKWLVDNRSGSLESCEPSSRVCSVRSFKDSVLCYAKNGFPQVYQLKLENAVVK